MISVLIAFLFTVQQPSSELDTVIRRSAVYVAKYEAELGNLIATEDYVQNWANLREKRRSQRRMSSDLLIIKVGPEWAALRKVNWVDGRKVKKEQDGFKDAFGDSPTENSKRLYEMKKNSTEYNLGDVLREINLPTFALKVLREENVSHFSFEKTGVEKIEGIQVWKIDFAERGLQTLVRGDRGERLYSTGTLWIEPETGRVLKTEFLVANPYTKPAVKAQSVVTYNRGKTIAMWLPRHMFEHYETSASLIECNADYSNFHRFEVEVKFNFGSTPPPR